MAACKAKPKGCADGEERSIRDKYIALSNDNIDKVKQMIVAGDVEGIIKLEDTAASSSEVTGAFRTRQDEEIFTGRQSNITNYGSVYGAYAIYGDDVKRAQDVAKFRSESCQGISNAACNGLVQDAMAYQAYRFGILGVVGTAIPLTVKGMQNWKATRVKALETLQPVAEIDPIKTDIEPPRTSGGTANSATAPKLSNELNRVAKPDPVVNKEADGKVTYSYGEVDRGQGLDASLDSKGVLRLEVKAPESGPRRAQYGSGSDMFDDMMRNVSKNGDIKQIEGQWSNKLGLSDNYEAYKQNIAQGMTPKDAAANTWTGKQAAKYGFEPDADNIKPDGRGGFVVPFIKMKK
jgi:hypothetical protein